MASTETIESDVRASGDQAQPTRRGFLGRLTAAVAAAGALFLVVKGGHCLEGQARGLVLARGSKDLGVARHPVRRVVVTVVVADQADVGLHFGKRVGKTGRFGIGIDHDHLALVVLGGQQGLPPPGDGDVARIGGGGRVRSTAGVGRRVAAHVFISVRLRGTGRPGGNRFGTAP